MNRSLLQLAVLSLLALLALVGLECRSRGSQAAGDETSELQLIARSGSPR